MTVLTVVLLSLFFLGKAWGWVWGGHAQCVMPDKFSLPKPVVCLPLSLSLFLCMRTSALPLCVYNSQGQQPQAQPFNICVCTVLFPCVLQEPPLRQLSTCIRVCHEMARWHRLALLVCVCLYVCAFRRWEKVFINMWDCTSTYSYSHVQPEIVSTCIDFELHQCMKQGHALHYIHTHIGCYSSTGNKMEP